MRQHAPVKHDSNVFAGRYAPVSARIRQSNCHQNCHRDLLCGKDGLSLGAPAIYELSSMASPRRRKFDPLPSTPVRSVCCTLYLRTLVLSKRVRGLYSGVAEINRVEQLPELLCPLPLQLNLTAPEAGTSRLKTLFCISGTVCLDTSLLLASNT